MHPTQDNAPPTHLILFDGVCNLCNAAVNFVIDRDRRDRFRFASLQSSVGQATLLRAQLSPDKLATFLYVKNGRIFTRSRAALEVARTLGGVWAIGYVFVLVPAFLRDGVYDFIAAHRYRWFGMSDSCRIPTPALRRKFIDV